MYEICEVYNCPIFPKVTTPNNLQFPAFLFQLKRVSPYVQDNHLFELNFLPFSFHKKETFLQKIYLGLPLYFSGSALYPMI
jgi:hypothetical protein